MHRVFRGIFRDTRARFPSRGMPLKMADRSGIPRSGSKAIISRPARDPSGPHRARKHPPSREDRITGPHPGTDSILQLNITTTLADSRSASENATGFLSGPTRPLALSRNFGYGLPNRETRRSARFIFIVDDFGKVISVKETFVLVRPAGRRWFQECLVPRNVLENGGASFQCYTSSVYFHLIIRWSLLA